MQLIREEYKTIMNHALQAEHGIRLPFGDRRTSDFARAQFYRLRERLRREEGCRDYDPLTFRIVDGNLCVVRRDRVPPPEDRLSPIQPVSMSKGEARNLPVWPRFGRRTNRH